MIMTVLACATLLPTPTVAAGPRACRVKNLDTRVVKRSLQLAVNAASPHHRLTIRGTCVGSATIDKPLTIRGVRRAGSGPPTLMRRGGSRSVLTTNARRSLVIRDLTVRGGGRSSRGGGIENGGKLILRNVVVRDNRAGYGGGIYNTGRLFLLGWTSVRRNAADVGGGIFNDGNVIMRGTSSVRQNLAQFEGGGIAADSRYARLEMWATSSVRDNTADTGGGVWLRNGALTMSGAATITGNAAVDWRPVAGGLFAEDVLLTGIVCAPDPDANVFDNTREWVGRPPPPEEPLDPSPDDCVLEPR